MSIVCEMNVPTDKMGVFHSILCRTHGRYLSVPDINGNTTRVHFEFGDYVKFHDAWTRAITPIVERRRDQKWRVFFRRMGLKWL